MKIGTKVKSGEFEFTVVGNNENPNGHGYCPSSTLIVKNSSGVTMREISECEEIL